MRSKHVFASTSLLLLPFILCAQTRYDPNVLPKGREYFDLRDGLANCQLKCEREKTGRIAFLGGSITAGGGWRDHFMKYFREKFPQTKFDFVGAGIPSLGSVPHAFRLERDVLSKETVSNEVNWEKLTPVVQLDKVASLTGPNRLIVTPQGANFKAIDTGASAKNIAFTSIWDNWPRKVTVPVDKAGEAVWLLVCGSTNPMQGRIENAGVTFGYADGNSERIDLVPPFNFWSLLPFGSIDYDYKKDGFALPKNPPPQVQLGKNCRAMVYGRKLRPGVALKEVTLETLSQEVVIGLMGVSVMNPTICN